MTFEEMQRKIKDIVWDFAKSEGGARVMDISVEWEVVHVRIGETPSIHPKTLEFGIASGVEAS